MLLVSHGVTLATYLWSVGWETSGALPNASISAVQVPGGGEPPRLLAVGLESWAGSSDGYEIPVYDAYHGPSRLVLLVGTGRRGGSSWPPCRRQRGWT